MKGQIWDVRTFQFWDIRPPKFVIGVSMWTNLTHRSLLKCLLAGNQGIERRRLRKMAPDTWTNLSSPKGQIRGD
jgi:hypothetical protein